LILRSTVTILNSPDLIDIARYLIDGSNLTTRSGICVLDLIDIARYLIDGSNLTTRSGICVLI
jgi:hypothetical protein